MNEANTRAELIDPQLEASGWRTGGDVRVYREYPITQGEIRAGGIRRGALVADYVLIYKNQKLAVVEAKSDEEEVGEGVAQAKIYAKKLGLETSFAANGKDIYQMSLKAKDEGFVKKFPTPDELWEKTFGESNEWLEKFNSVPFEDLNGTKQARYYQELAINNVMKAIANKKKRVLLTLATGTGKTFIAFQIAWKLFKTRWNKQLDGKRQPRILFITDRNNLADQAFLDFGGFNDDALSRINPTKIRKNGEVPKNASVFFTIFQTFISGPKKEPYFGQYEKDFFDFVIIDECHRGGANDESTWREILNHFDTAVHLGLTATPKRDVNVDTYDYFGEPVYIYSLKEGIQDGFLTPFRVKSIQTNIDSYKPTSDDEVLEGEVEKGRIYQGKDWNRNIEIQERERKLVQEMLNAIIQNEKTIVFCVNQSHAALVRDLINQEVKNRDIDYCVRVTSNEGKIGDSYLRQFQDNEKLLPTILTTSQKLTTGVDARNVRNVVLMRPIDNMIQFKQIIGRGTRLFDGKHYFTIVDFYDSYHHFQDDEWDGEPLEPPESTDREPPEGTDREPWTFPPDDGEDGSSPPKKVKIRLADGKAREIQSMTSTYFYLDGKTINAEQYLKKLFDTLKLPSLFNSEEELREIWSNPITRKELLDTLEKENFHKEDLVKLQELINAEDSDLFDVLEYIAYAKPPITRSKRVESNKSKIFSSISEKNTEFINFVLQNYINFGDDELEITNLSSILNSKYESIQNAEDELGTLEEIQKTFIDFQKHLYAEAAI